MNHSQEMPLKDFRQTIRKASWARLLFVVTATLLIFIAALLSHLRFDWTEDRIYTLSESTLSVLNGLEEPILIRAYVTEGLPQPYGRLNRFLEDILLSYHDVGGGNVGFEVVDPADDPNVAASLAAMQIPKIQVQTIEDDQAQVKQGYLAVVIEYLDSRETIPVVQSEEGFEYLLTRKIKKLTGKGRARVGVVSGFGATDLYELRKLTKLVADDYELVDVEPEKGVVDPDITTLIVAGLDQPPSDAFRYHIDQFRMRGGSLLLLAGNVKPMLSAGFQVEPVATHALEWIREDLDIAIEPGLIMDRRATRVTVNRQRGGFAFSSLVDYPFLPSVTSLEKGHAVTDGLEGVSVPFSSPLTWVGSKTLAGQELMRSSNRSGLQSGPPFDVDPLVSTDSRFAGVTERSLVLALAIEGESVSNFKTVPDGVTGTKHLVKGMHSRMIAVGSASFLDDEFMSGGNLIATLNMIDWLSGDEALISLRSRGVTQRPIEELSSAGRAFFKGLWMFGLPMFMALLGVWRWWMLKRQAAFFET